MTNYEARDDARNDTRDPQPWRWGRQRFEDADPAGQDFDFDPEWDPRPGYEPDRSKYE